MFTVHENRLPRVSPLANPGPTDWGIPITFSGFGTDPDGGSQDSLKYVWDFGDGTSAINNKVDHAYAKPGPYTVSLTVTDKDGGSTTVTRERDDHQAHDAHRELRSCPDWRAEQWQRRQQDRRLPGVL